MKERSDLRRHRGGGGIRVDLHLRLQQTLIARLSGADDDLADLLQQGEELALQVGVGVSRVDEVVR